MCQCQSVYVNSLHKRAVLCHKSQFTAKQWWSIVKLQSTPSKSLCTFFINPGRLLCSEVVPPVTHHTLTHEWSAFLMAVFICVIIVSSGIFPHGGKGGLLCNLSNNFWAQRVAQEVSNGPNGSRKVLVHGLVIQN